MNGKTIRLLLVNGTPTGVIAAEVLNWTGKVYLGGKCELRRNCHSTIVLTMGYVQARTTEPAARRSRMRRSPSDERSQGMNFSATIIRRFSKREFFSLLWPAFERAVTPKNIVSGWEKTGLYPLNPERVLS